jgi:PAS domain S-box-containing protein
MATPLRLLILEDNLSDAELVLHALRRAGYNPTADRVESEGDYRDHLQTAPEIILADFSMPNFDALRALEIMQECQLDIPFIIVSGSIGEDVAVKAMRQGATDYLLKDRLGRLGQAVTQAMEQKRLREAKRRAEQALCESQEKTRVILDTAYDPFIAMDAGGRITEWNVQAVAVFGWQREEALGRRLSETIIPSRYREAHERGLQHFHATGEGPLLNRRIEIAALHRDGHEIPVELIIWPARVGGTESFNAFVRDITARKQAERRQATMLALSRVLAESTTLSEATPKILQEVCQAFGWQCGDIWAVDRSGKLLRCVEIWHAPAAHFPEFEALTRRTTFLPGICLPGRVWTTGKPILIPDVTTDAEFLRAPVAQKEGLHAALGFPILIGRKVTGVFEFFSQDIFPPDDDFLEMCASIGQQIGQFVERKQSEEARHQSEEQVRLLLNSTAEAIYGLDPEGNCTFCNQACVRLLGYAQANDLIGKHMHRLIHHKHSDGRPYPDKQCRIYQAFRLGEETHVDDEVFWRADGTSFSAEYWSHPIRREGQIVGAVVTFLDISERRNLEDQFRQVQKMEAFGQLAAGVAHDFNNLLTIILGYSELFLSMLPAADSGREPVEQIRKAGERAAALTRQLLAFGRRQILCPVVLDLNSLVTEIEKMLRRLIGADIELTTILQPGLGRVKADPGQVEQIIMNLVVNACDAMPTGGGLTIQTHNTVLSELQVRQHAELPPGPYTVLAVTDTGSGMDDATKARIFEPFFTTKEVGKGTGLGLATVFGIVKQSGGFIEVESALGSGSTFRTYFPQIRQATQIRVSDHGLVRMSRGVETILLVEDEDGLRELARVVLEASGYKVLTARNAGEAVQVCHKNAEDIHLLFTDVVMPKMSGRELAGVLLPSRPNMKVLYMSGYTDDTMVRHGIQQAGTNFLPKPFTPIALAQKVRDVLDGTNGQQDTAVAGGSAPAEASVCAS